ncbi:MAG: GNAT family N-acetyltransferase [Planctomycetota bacterium]
MDPVHIQLEPTLGADEFLSVLHRSSLAERRPVHDRPRIEAMLQNADILITARTPAGELIGVARSISDFVYCTYLSDLAVDATVQRSGIGRRLIEATHAAAQPGCKLILLAAPAAREYYPRIGFDRHDSCWIQAHPRE